MLRALLAFLVTSALLFLIALISDPALANLTALILIGGLLFWSKRFKEPREMLKAEIATPIALTSLSLLTRIPSVAFFRAPLEKAPVLYALFMILLLRERSHPEAIGLSRRKLFKNILLGICGWAAFSVLFYGLRVFCAALGDGLSSVSFWIAPLTLNFAFLVNSVWAYAAVGLSEEALFRGYMLEKAREVLGPLVASLLSSVIFGAWHFVWHVQPLDLYGMAYHMVFALVAGLFLCALYLWTGSLIGPIVFHGTWNVSTGLFHFEMVGRVATLAYILSGLAIAAISLVFIRLAPSRKPEVHVEGKDRGNRDH